MLLLITIFINSKNLEQKNTDTFFTKIIFEIAETISSGCCCSNSNFICDWANACTVTPEQTCEQKFLAAYVNALTKHPKFKNSCKANSLLFQCSIANNRDALDLLEELADATGTNNLPTFYNTTLTSLEKTCVPFGIDNPQTLSLRRQSLSSITSKTIALADKGDVSALAAAGQYCFDGVNGIPKDEIKALDYWQLGAQQQDIPCKIALAIYYSNQTTLQDKKTAYTLYTEVISQGYTEHVHVQEKLAEAIKALQAKTNTTSLTM